MNDADLGLLFSTLNEVKESVLEVAEAIHVLRASLVEIAHDSTKKREEDFDALIECHVDLVTKLIDALRRPNRADVATVIP